MNADTETEVLKGIGPTLGIFLFHAPLWLLPAGAFVFNKLCYSICPDITGQM